MSNRTTTAAASSSPPVDRRSRRRQETIDEILDISVELMARDGVGGLSLAEVARRMGIQPPSLYKYFDSKLAVYDAIFERGSREALSAFLVAVSQSKPGLEALCSGLEAIARLALAKQVMAQLMIWRPVPGFQPSPAAFAPNIEFVDAVREQVGIAVKNGELDKSAMSDEALSLISVLQTGVVSQQLANEPSVRYEAGRFTRLMPKVLAMFIDAYQPKRKG